VRSNNPHEVIIQADLVWPAGGALTVNSEVDGLRPTEERRREEECVGPFVLLVYPPQEQTGDKAAATHPSQALSPSNDVVLSRKLNIITTYLTSSPSNDVALSR